MNEQLFKDLLESRDKIIIELGCGPSKKNGVIGIDVFPLDGVDIVADLENGLNFIPDNTVDELLSVHFLEHISNLELLIKEIYRVLKPDGVHNVIVPHFSNPHYYSDLTHKKFFGLYTFDYYATDTSKLKRAVPGFYNDFKFVIQKRKLVFKSQFFIRNLIKKWIFTKVFNVNIFMQELYEECFTGLFPCSEIQFIMKPQKQTPDA
jgi:ubiquinone/menaquinone biosynthesis C-methylase UbiE